VARSTIARRLGGPDARRRRHRRVAALLGGLLVVALVLLLVAPADDGNGDGDGAGEAAATTTVPAGRGATDVASVCRASNVEIGTAQQALLGGNEAPDAVEGFLADAFVDLTRRRADAIRAADPPPSEAVLALVAEHDAVVDAIEADPAAAASSPTNPFEALNRRWRDAGLADCAIDTSTVPQG